MVNRAVVASVINKLDGQVAPKTIKNSHSVLSGVLQTAVYEGHLDSNPARGSGFHVPASRTWRRIGT